MAEVTISIIIPSYQQGEKLQEALSSIEAQTCNDYEIIIMDGGSRDGTEDVVNKYKHLPIIFKSDPDNGIYDAMNKGIELSSGLFIYFMGCDDRLAGPSILADIFNQKSNLEYDFLYGNVIFTVNNKVYDGKFSKPKLFYKNICHQAIFVKKEVFKKIGNFNIKYKYLADWYFNMQCFSSIEIEKKYLPIIVAYYNNAGSSFTLPDENFSMDRNNINKECFPTYINFIHDKLPRLSKFLFAS